MNVNQYKNLIRAYFKRHEQINTVKTGNQYNFNADKRIIYRVANIEYIDQRGATGGFLTDNFLITIGDLFDPNLEDSDIDIISDCTDIANDCIAYFGNLPDNSFTINENVTVKPWDNGHTDKLRGVSFMLSFTDDPEINECNQPITNI